MEKDFALIIGINDYTPPDANGLRTLGGAIRDANDFEEWVLNPNGGNVPKANCRKIISNPNPLKPIQKEIDDAYLELDELIGNGDGQARRFYFYFSGHGVGLMNATKEIALCLANWSEKRRHEALGAELYKETFNQYGYFDEIIFILDCCRNTKVNINPAHPSFSPIIPGQNAGQTKLFTAYATQYQDQSFEAEEENSEMRGVFTKVLLDGLKGDAPNENGIITADGLKDYLMKQTPIEAQKKGYKQIPQIIVDSFTKETPFISLVNFQSENITCYIIFSDARNGDVELIDNSGVINSYNASQQKNVQVSLSKGLYLLRDTVTGDKYPIQVLPSNKEIHVDF